MLIQKNVLMITERQKMYHNYVSRNTVLLQMATLISETMHF